jgi:asparagine synthetase A
MHRKNIKFIVRKQLKKQYPNWNRLSRKENKAEQLQAVSHIHQGQRASIC